MRSCMHVHTYRQLRILDRLSVSETSQLLNDNNYERRFNGLLYRVIGILLGCQLKLSLIFCSLTPPKTHLRMQLSQYHLVTITACFKH